MPHFYPGPGTACRGAERLSPTLGQASPTEKVLSIQPPLLSTPCPAHPQRSTWPYLHLPLLVLQPADVVRVLLATCLQGCILVVLQGIVLSCRDPGQRGRQACVRLGSRCFPTHHCATLWPWTLASQLTDGVGFSAVQAEAAL